MLRAMRAWILVAALVCCSASQVAEPVLTPEIVADLALWARYNAPAPTGSETIYIHSQAAHHTTVQISTIASRDAAGRWTVSSMGEERAGLLQLPAKPIAATGRPLAADQARKLEALLASDRLYQEAQAATPRTAVIGAAFYTMEIVTPTRHAVFRWTGRLPGRAGKVADLLLNR